MHLLARVDVVPTSVQSLPGHPTPAWNTRDGTRQVRCGPLIARHSQQEFPARAPEPDANFYNYFSRAKTAGQTLGHISAPTLSIKKKRRRPLSTCRQKKKELSIVYTVMPHAALYSRCSLPNTPRTGHLSGWYAGNKFLPPQWRPARTISSSWGTRRKKRPTSLPNTHPVQAMVPPMRLPIPLPRL